MPCQIYIYNGGEGLAAWPPMVKIEGGTMPPSVLKWKTFDPYRNTNQGLGSRIWNLVIEFR